jgi:hypothetical protein
MAIAAFITGPAVSIPRSERHHRVFEKRWPAADGDPRRE